MIYVASRTGQRHAICEDAALVGTELVSGASKILQMPETGFVCLADGVGGNHGGAQAARYVLESLAMLEKEEDLHAALPRINMCLIEKAKDTPEASNMATTLTGIRYSNGNSQLVHVGNTRAYIRQGRYLKQITSDHTTYNWLKDLGQAEAAAACNKNEITNCFGGANKTLLSRLVVSDLPPFSLMILTSDGIHEHVDLDTLEEILFGEGTYDDKCEALLDEASKNGSEDDMTIVVIAPEEE